MAISITNNLQWTSQMANVDSATQRDTEMFQKLDTNGDGKIDASELKSVMPSGVDTKSLMKQIDSNGDGSIDQSEFDAFLAKADGKMKSGGPPPGSPPPGGAKASGNAGGLSSGSSSSCKIYDPMDTNKDGKVSFMERLMYGFKHPESVKKTSGQTNSVTNIQTYDQRGQSITATSSGLLNALV